MTPYRTPSVPPRRSRWRLWHRVAAAIAVSVLLVSLGLELRSRGDAEDRYTEPAPGAPPEAMPPEP